MRAVILLTILFNTCQVAIGQKFLSRIDSLTTAAEVEKLLRLFDRYNEQFTIKPITSFTNEYRTTGSCKAMADSLGITEAFYKTDFDKNGYTDLLAIGDHNEFSIFILMNYGRDSVKLTGLTRGFLEPCSFPKIINDTIIRYTYYKQPGWKLKDPISGLQTKDLVFKFGDFVEQNPKPANYGIEKIEYRTTGCYGECPIFTLSINKDQSAVFSAGAFNRRTEKSRPVIGTFRATIKDSSFSAIIDLLNYIDFPHLKDDYVVHWNHDQTSILTVTYNNGQVKTIKDYGLLGSYGLQRLYHLLFDMRFNQDWK
jgi:hypothetical protein